MNATWEQIKPTEWVGAIRFDQGADRGECAVLVTVGQPFGDGERRAAAEVQVFPRRRRDAKLLERDRAGWDAGAYPIPAHLFVVAPAEDGDAPQCPVCAGAGAYVPVLGGEEIACTACGGSGEDLAARARVVAEALVGQVER